jgi:tetraacyldisaccharide 4'-kinase
LKDHWVETGDEPLLFKQRLQEKIDVVVGKDRFYSAQMAEKRGNRTLLLDDGMQARFIHRDLEITLLNSHDLFGGEAFLPAGFLRESPKGLKRSDYIILNHVHDGEHFEKTKERVLAFTKRPVIGMRPRLSSIKELNGQEVNKKERGAVALFCAIAEPHFFYGLVKKAGFSIAHTLFLPDHDFLSFEELLSFTKQAAAKGAHSVLCTEKDKVKINPKAFFPLPVRYVEMDLEIAHGKEIFEEMVQRIVSSSNRADSLP